MGSEKEAKKRLVETSVSLKVKINFRSEDRLVRICCFCALSDSLRKFTHHISTIKLCLAF